MACINTKPGCSTGTGEISPLGKFTAVTGGIGTAASVVGILAKVAGATGALATAGPVIVVVAAALAVIVVIALYANNRCTEPDGTNNCIAGCISNIKPSFSDASETVFPFTANPNRVDVTLKSFFWGLIDNDSYVYCTDEEFPRRSEIVHTYYYTKKVCAAEDGALVGAGAGAIGGIIAGLAVAAALCTTFILCILGLILAIIIVVVAVLIGAFSGGNIARAATDDNSPTGSTPLLPTKNDNILKVGQFVSQHGNTVKSGEDNNANVLWWVHTTTIHGEIAPGTPQPFSYCEIDDQFIMDACDRAVVIL